MVRALPTFDPELPSGRTPMPDFYHGRPEVAVINTLVLDAQHRPVESYTMRFGLEQVYRRRLARIAA
jgi:hypothetical protein